jgi:site-specific DNA-cytosine methylase
VEKKHVVVTADRNGNFTPLELHGATVIPEGEVDMVRFVEQRVDSFFLRPLSSRFYRCLALCCGAGVDSEAARRAGFRVVMAAESQTTLHEEYRDRFGVMPEMCNCDAIKLAPRDIVMVTFGTECRSVSCPGAQDGLSRSEDWETFIEAAKMINEDEVLCFHYENVGSVLENEKFGDVKNLILSAFQKNYVVKYGVADAAEFGTGVSRRRMHVIGMRRDAASVCGFEAGHIIDRPFDNKPCVPKCVSDFMVDRDGPLADDQVDLVAWCKEREKETGDEWIIEWLPKYRTLEDRLSIKRFEGCQLKKPITLGYVKRSGYDTLKFTGFKIGHVYGQLHGLTHASMHVDEQGPGKNSSFYFDPLTKRIATLGVKTIRRLWTLEDWADISVRNMGKSAHPATTQANLQVLALYLDKYFAAKASIPPMPRIAFESIEDIFLPKTMTKFSDWRRSVISFANKCRANPLRNSKAPEPFVINNCDLHFWARGWVFDLRGDKPVRLMRHSRPRHKIRLSRLEGMEDYDDLDVFIIFDFIGSSNGSNPPDKSVMHSNDCGFYRNEVVALKEFREELSRDWIQLHSKIPFCPVWCNPHFMLWQGDKWRRIYNCSKEFMGMSVNSMREWLAKAKLELVQYEWLTDQIGDLMRKRIFLAERGVDCEMQLFVVDLWKAYNQLSVDMRDQWLSCSSVVDEEGHFHFVEMLRTSFGPENAPMVWSRGTRATTWSIDFLLNKAKDFFLQNAYREMLGSDDVVLPDTGLTPVSPRKKSSHAKKLDVLEERWRNDDRLSGLLPLLQILRPGASTSKEDLKKLYALATYLDDCFGVLLVPSASGNAKRAHYGGKMLSNKEVARKAFERRTGVKLPVIHISSSNMHRFRGYTGGRGDSGEYLRMKYIRKVYERAGFIVVNDERSKGKWDKGKCSPRLKILGCIVDLSDPTNPTIELPEDKRVELLGLVRAVLDSRPAARRNEQWVPEEVWQSIVGKLNHATRPNRRGRIHMTGLYSGLGKSQREGFVKVGAWQERNLIWWARRLAEKTIPSPLFRKVVSIEKKYCAHSDASTGWGFGSFWIVGDKCYYIQEEWTDEEKELINNENLLFEDKKGTCHRMGINFLEMATVGMTLETAKGNFQEKDFTFFCDNETSVKILNSYRTRTLPFATLLENIDENMSMYQLNIEFKHIRSEDNIESDWLSRGLEHLDDFFKYIKKTYNVSSFVHMKVAEGHRDLAKIVRQAKKHPEWIVADGRGSDGQ